MMSRRTETLIGNGNTPPFRSVRHRQSNTEGQNINSTHQIIPVSDVWIYFLKKEHDMENSQQPNAPIEMGKITETC